MSMIDKNILNDIEEILKLSQKAHAKLKELKIPKAKEELRKVIMFDLDELRRLQREQGDKRLLDECIAVFRDAKMALRDLDSMELFDEAKELIDQIVRLEEHELMEANEDEKRDDELYNIWNDELQNILLYHGTTSIVEEKIKKYGLVPFRFPWDKADFDRLASLFDKAGYPIFRQYYRSRMDKEKEGGIFLSAKKEDAISYSRQGPEIFAFFISSRNWKNRNRVGALKETYSRIMYGYMSDNMKVTAPQLQEYLSLYDTNRRAFLQFVRRTTYLKPDEINEVIRIFNKYWDIFEKSRRMILSISVQAPAILEHLHQVRDFKIFLRWVGRWMGRIKVHSIEEIRSKVTQDLLHFETNMRITKRIPPTYIIKYEFID
jgi:hypothetical protein